MNSFQYKTLVFAVTHKVAILLTLVILILLGRDVYHARHEPNVDQIVQNVPVQVTPEAKVITVPGPITTKTVTKFVNDPADKALIDALLKQNAQYKTQPESLTETTGTLTQERTIEAVPAAPGTPASTRVNFKDWHLEFTADGAQARYKLNQRFVVLATTGRSQTGQPLSLTNLYEVGSNDERIPVTGLETTAVYTDQTQPHFFVGLNVQGGIVATAPIPGAGLGTSGTRGGLVGLQWLKRGRTNAPGDISFALLTPAIIFKPGNLGVLPVSWNVGRHLKPLSNIWISPYISQTQIGLAATVTF